MKALVLSGGGARGAYQVGVIKALAEICRKLGIKNPFRIYTGTSAGAINASCMAWGADRFSEQSDFLTHLWSKLDSDHVYQSDILSLGRMGIQSLGGFPLRKVKSGKPMHSLLDTTPLSELISTNMNYSRLDELIRDGKLEALAVTALDYKSSSAVTFVQGQKELTNWKRLRRYSISGPIKTEHIMASSAIPLLFPPIEVGNSYYGDGCVRNITPLSPAIHLGADELFVIGVRKLAFTMDDARAQRSMEVPTLARILNVLMNSVLLDGVETDIERLDKINSFMEKIEANSPEQLNFKKVTRYWIQPSVDIGQVAIPMAKRLPRLVRYMLKALGPMEDASEIISYLLFDPEFCQTLIQIGYEDGMRDEAGITGFLTANISSENEAAREDRRA